MSPARIVQHPLYASLAPHGQRLAARLRQVPMPYWRNLCLALIALWIVRSLATAVWVLFPAPELEQPPLAPPLEIGSAAPQAADIDLSALQKYHLFGEGGMQTPEAEPAPEVAMPGIEQEAVDTSLDLRLQGVMASSDPDNAWAIIGDGNKQALYRVGDRLPQGNNVSLVKVLDQRVILDNNGRYESLWLYSEDDAQYRETQQAYDDSDRSQVQEQYREYYRDNPDEEGYVVDPQNTEPRPEEADDGQVHTLPASAGEITSISEVVRFTAARTDDGLMGYRVQPGRNRELFQQAGLEPGDVVTAVNGIELDDPRQIRSVYQALQTAPQADLSILRDGEPVQVTITLDSAR